MARKTTEELAIDAFRAEELVKSYQMMNTPSDVQERERLFVATALAEEELRRARVALTMRIYGVTSTREDDERAG